MRLVLGLVLAALLPACAGATSGVAPRHPSLAEGLADRCSRAPSSDGLLLEDSFVADPRSGALGDALTLRQRGPWAPVAWVVADGSSGATLGSPLVRVSDATRPGLDLRGNVSVRLDRPILLRLDRRYRIEACIDPVAGDVESLGWVSISLATEGGSIGWVTAPEMMLGFLVRSRGAIQVFSAGDERTTPLREGLVSPRSVHDVVLELEPDAAADPPGWTLRGSVDDRPFEATLAGHDPTRPVFVHLGAHFHPGDLGLSRVERIAVSELPL